MAQIRKTAMTMDNLDLLPDEDLSEQRKGAEDRRESRGPIDYPVWQMVDFEAVCKVPYA